MFDPTQLPINAQVVLLRELSTLVAAGINPDTSGIVAAEVLDELIATSQQIELALCTSIERVDRTGIFAQDGSRSAVAYVRRAGNETNAWASRRVRLGRALADSLPVTRAAWHDGTLGMAQAEIIARAVDSLEPGLAAEIDSILATAATQISTSNLSGLADLIVAQAAPEDAAARDKANHDRQHLTLVKTLHGQWKLDGRFDNEAGTAIRQVLDGFTRKPEPLVDADGTLNELTSAGFRRAEALAEICRQASGHAENCSTGSGKTTLVITTDHDDLTHGTGVGDVEGGTVLSNAALRRLACDATVVHGTLGPDGQLLDTGRRTRHVSQAQRIFLIARDGGCVFPGCDVVPAWCQAHHIIHWTSHGRTDRCNLVLLCHFHHHLVHESGWTTTGDADHLLFHPPDDRPPRAAQRHHIRQQLDSLVRQ